MPVPALHNPQFPAAHKVLTDAIEQHAFPGAAYGVLLDGEVLTVAAAGRFTYHAAAPLVLPETVFDLASVSKVVATTAMAMLLWERGQLDLEEPVGDRLPEFLRAGNADKHKVTAKMLLAHSSGLPAYARLFERRPDAAALLAACMGMPLEAEPGTRAEYSDIGFIVLGRLLERLAGEALDSFCQREVFAPLAMQSTMYCPAPPLRASIPPTAIDDYLRHKIIQGEVHDENCYVLGGVSGHAGVFSNVSDLLRFAACILNARCIPGEGTPIFQPRTVDLFTTRQLRPTGTSRALGWDTPSVPSSSGSYFSAHSAGHFGFTGTSLWIDFETRLAIALLTNRTFPGNGESGFSKKIQQVRPRFHDTLRQELGLASTE